MNFAYSQGDAPPLLQGQHQSTKSVGSFIQAPNKQITKISGATSLVETGNQNLLENPSFEHSTFSTAWTDTSTGTSTVETSTVIHGKKSYKIEVSSQDINLVQNSTLYQAQFGGSVQGLASIRIKGDVSVKVCSVQSGSVSVENCLDTSTDNNWHFYKLPFILGSTSNGISIAGTGLTGTVYLDDAFVGAADIVATTDASRIAGEAYFAPTSSCVWSRSNATIGAFSSNSACPGPTIVKEYVGDFQTTDANLPKITVNSLPAGVYKATFFVPTYSGITSQNAIAINDGTTTCQAVTVNSATSSGQGVISCVFEYANTGNRSFELYGSSTTSSINIENNTSGDATKGTKFILEYYTSISSYSSTDAKYYTQWTDFNDVSAGTLITSTAGSPAYGTVQRNEAQWKRQGSDILIRWDYRQSTAGSVGSGNYLFNIPAETGCTIDTTKAPGNTGTTLVDVNARVGTMSATFSTTGNAVGGVYVYDSTKLKVALSGTNSSGGASAYTWGASSGYPFSTSAITYNLEARIPCVGWTDSNIIIGQFNGLESCTDTLECTDTFSAKISSAGTVSDENINWISGNSSGSAGVYTLTFVTGIFTAAPNCALAMQTITTNRIPRIDTISATEIVVRTRDTGLTDAAANFQIICQKQGADYIGKTAKAVASDQNVATPGVTKSTFCSAKISSTGVISDQKGGCFASCTNATTPVCTFTSNYWVSGQVPNCWASGGGIVGLTVTTSTETSTTMTNGTSATAQLSNRNYFCHGERQ